MAAADGAGVAVSLTPLPLDADSRTFRIATSLAEAGWRSVVVEGRTSARQFWDDTIEVRSMVGPAAGDSAVGGGGGRTRGMISALRDGRLGPFGEWPLYAAFRLDDWWRHCHRPLRVIPPAALYYVHSFELHRAVAPLAARLGARIIYDAHDFYRGIEPAAAQRVFDRKRLRPYLDRLEARFVGAADAVVTVTDGVAALIENTFGRRPAVIRNCHDERADRAVTVDLRTRLGLGEADRLCVAVGNCKPGMAVDIAVAALAQLPEPVHLAFLGRGYEAAAARLICPALARRLHFGHVVAPNEVVPTIRSADLGLVLYEPYSENYRWALPNGFLQIVAAGLPVVRGKLPEIEAAIGDRQIGVCLDRLEPGALAQAITLGLAGADRWRSGAAALARELRWETEALRLRRLIDGLGVRPDMPALARRGVSG